MSTSGSYNWTNTRNQIIAGSLRLLGIMEPTPQQFYMGNEALNVMVKDLQADLELTWKREWKTKTFTASEEVTGTDGEVYTCIRSHTSASSNKPITGADYSTYWYLRGDTGGTWADATAYTSIGDFDLDADTISIEKAFVREQNSDYELDIIGLDKYLDVFNKYNEGKPTRISIDWQLTPKAYLYKQPDDADAYVLHYLRMKLVEDFDAAGNTPDFHVRWIRYLIHELAGEIGWPFVMSNENGLAMLDRIQAKANKLYANLKRDNSESSGGDFISPAYKI